MALNSFLKQAEEVGIDEVGRGCLAGPVVAAAVILPRDFYHKDLNDSKVLSEKKRLTLRYIIEKEAIDYGVAFVEVSEIDEINILNASILAMHKAVIKLKKKPPHLVVDGNRFYPYKEVPYTCIVGGDAKYMSVAAASILAKTHRDEYMVALHAKWPHYLWIKNKGYPTLKHRLAIRKHGVSPHHRLSFKLLPPEKYQTIKDA